MTGDRVITDALLDVTWADVAAGALVVGIVVAGVVLAVALWVPRCG